MKNLSKNVNRIKVIKSTENYWKSSCVTVSLENATKRRSMK